MGTDLVRTAFGLALALTVIAVPLPGDRASASCVSPYLTVDGGRDRPLLRPGEEVTVEGRAFVIGCDDTGGSTVWGCSADDGETVTPMRDVGLRIRQQRKVWELGSVDAGTAAEDRLGHASWTVVLPEELRPGRATLVADEAEPLRVRVPGRRGG